MGSTVRNVTLMAAIAVLALTGCAARVHQPFESGYQTARLLPAAVRPDRYDYQREWTYPNSKSESETDNYRVESLTMRSVGENGQVGNLVTARYYRSKRPGPRPLVIVLPVWGIHTYPPNTISSDLRRRSVGAVDVLQVLGDNTLFDWPALIQARNEQVFLSRVDRMVDRFINTVIDIRRLVDWAEAQPEVDSDRIALIGFSMGAIVGSVAIANEPRIDAGIMVMGGGEIHKAFAVCDSRMGRVRKNAIKRFGWTAEQLAKRLEPYLASIDPVNYPGRVNPGRVLLIEADKDSCLPEAGRDRLWNAMGRPERISYLYDHKMSFLAMTFLGGNNLQRQVYGFLNRAFDFHPPEIRYEANRAVEAFNETSRN